ncbi:TPA: translesion error-prone DNA polymerase V autoproteolytic subunit [Morganella morganii]|uniref:translesion error-prone DNA polymerase V autoproteolytic subunit n=1 Tax=Morganella morganii TaxID=582 RepID=UPI00280EE0AA|nr:translesion error-prone DNA polymerase V autoproteolytic subunit [Morganella morganii]
MSQVPLFDFPVSCGFPSPAEDFAERRISLDAELVRYPESTYFLRAQGHSMKDAGIFDGDLLVVESYETAGDGDIVIAELNGEFTCKYLKTHPVKALVPANEACKPVIITDETDIRIFGIVRFAVHQTGR